MRFAAGPVIVASIAAFPQAVDCDIEEAGLW